MGVRRLSRHRFKPMSDTWNETLTALEGRADSNGTVPYRIALAVAETLGIELAFEYTYGEFDQWRDTGVDVGEFSAWALSLA